MTSPLNLLFVNNTGLAGKEVFITFQNPSLGNTNFEVTYDGGKTVPFASQNNIMSTSLSLETIGSEGFVVTKLASGIIFVSYGKALTATTTVPSFIGSSGPDYNTPFQPFELTRVGGEGDQGNMTAINYFTAPMSIESYNGGVNGTLLQCKAYNKSAAEIAAQVGALTANNPSSVIKNNQGDIVRYIGPSSYGPADTNPFPSLLPYLEAVKAAGQPTSVSNSNAFNQPAAGGQGSTNYNFTLNLTATVQADNSIRLDGDITTTITPFGQASSPGPTFSNASLTISASNLKALNFVLYGQALNTSIVSFGSGWSKLETYMDEKGLGTQGALNTTQNLAIGEITSGLLMGFVNSSVVPAGQSQPIKDLPSCQWWRLDPMIAFSNVQPQSADYNQYGNVIYKASNNQVYSIPYSDRLGTGPLINSVQYNDMDVDTWVVTLESPVPTSARSG